jgi:hypothetical protein
MKITLSIDSKDASDSIEISHADLAMIVSCSKDDLRHAIFYSRLFDHPASEVRFEVAGMSNMPTDTLELMARDTSIEVVRQVANNKRALRMFKVSLLQEMINRDVSVAADIADNLSRVHEDARTDVIQVLLQHTDPKIVETAKNYEGEVDETWVDDPN